MENNERKNVFECVICLGVPNDPVATTCGHVYCWLCLKNWLANKTVLQCPVCKNGIDPNKIISLFSGNSSGQKFFYIKISDPSKPKPERIDPVVNKNREGYFRSLLNGLGFYGTNNTANSRNLNEGVAPNETEVKMNQLALILFIVGAIMIISMLYN